MNRSESIESLAAALCAAQASMRGAKKDTKNPHLGSMYADLASCWEAVREPLTAQGLAVVQTPICGVEGTIGVTTVLMHKSGQWISGDMLIPLADKPYKDKSGTLHFDKMMRPTAQDTVAAVTYARRCGLSAIVGIAPEDDDGEATRPVPRPVPAAATSSVPANTNSLGAPSDSPAVSFAKELESANSLPALEAVAATIGAARKASAITDEERKTLIGKYVERQKALQAVAQEKAA